MAGGEVSTGGIWRRSSVEGKHKLSGKDVKKVRQALLEQGSASEEELAHVVPAKASMTLLKLSNKALVYTLDSPSSPVAFDPEGRGEIYPTLYTLWQIPHMLTPLLTHSEVTPKVLSGADLMMPGVVEPSDGLPEFSFNQHMSVMIPSNPYPLAVGKMETSSASVRQHGFKGKGMRVWHFFSDPLWALGDKSKPDKSFTPARIYPLGEGGGDAETSAEEAAAADEVGIQGASDGVSSLSLKPSEVGDGERASAQNGNDNTQNDNNVNEGERGEDDMGQGVDDASFDTSTPAGMDQALEYFFCKALANHLSDNDLPMQCEKFYSQYLLPSRPGGLTLDVKKSNHKKLPKLIKAIEKKGVITQKQVHKQDCIYTVHRQSQHLQGFDSSSRSSAPQRGPGNKERGQQKQEKQAEVSVHLMYKVPSNVRFVFGENALQNRERLFSEREIDQALRKYAEANNLLGESESASSPQQSKIDDDLAKSLFKKKEEYEAGSVVGLDELYKRLTDRLQLHNRIVVNRNGQTEEIVRKGKLRYIHIQTEDRHTGRKFITRVTGLEYYAIEPASFAGVVQRTFNTTASHAKLPGARREFKAYELKHALLICFRLPLLF